MSRNRRPAGRPGSSWLGADRDRITRSLSDVVVRRLFAAGPNHQVALGLIGEPPAVGKVHHAVGELDQAIRDIRDTVFDRLSGES